MNDDPGGSFQFNQWLAVDPVTGAVDLSWNDSRNDPTNHATDVFFTQSTNGGERDPERQGDFGPDGRDDHRADFGNQYGDYEGIDACGGGIHPIWTDRRTSVAALDEEAFTATLASK